MPLGGWTEAAHHCWPRAQPPMLTRAGQEYFDRPRDTDSHLVPGLERHVPCWHRHRRAAAVHPFHWLHHAGRYVARVLCESAQRTPRPGQPTPPISLPVQ
ncbi:hypothetical protein FOZ62_016810 [Perkinsus olseni]|uniref:Uncharacterized protein n=1 Tax=Perkinsus olseni TaxID=32597 RepID=A0A7J6RUW9_PEROL|nr:hypothetical protein FOZ62_016810 [Perkinsus olseni]